MQNLNINKRFQQGAATLIVALTLVTVLTIITVYGTQVGVTEQRITSSDYRNRQAIEAAQAGLEKEMEIISRNDLSATTAPLRRGPQSLSNDAKYDVTITSLISGSGNLVEVSSQGFSDDGSSTRTITQLLRYVPSSSAMTGRCDVKVKAKAMVYNTDTHRTVLAGGTIAAATYTHTDTDGNGHGVTSDSSLCPDHDNQAADDADEDNFFDLFFGKIKSDMKNEANESQNIYLNCSDNCTADLDAQLSDADKTGNLIYIEAPPGDFILLQNNVGTPNPKILIIDGDLKTNGGFTADGFVYVTGSWIQGTGGSMIHGSVAVEDTVDVNGNIEFHYNQSIMNQLSSDLGGSGAGFFTRTAGSWRDF